MEESQTERANIAQVEDRPDRVLWRESNFNDPSNRRRSECGLESGRADEIGRGRLTVSKKNLSKYGISKNEKNLNIFPSIFESNSFVSDSNSFSRSRIHCENFFGVFFEFDENDWKLVVKSIVWLNSLKRSAFDRLHLRSRRFLRFFDAHSCTSSAIWEGSAPATRIPTIRERIPGKILETSSSNRHTGRTYESVHVQENRISDPRKRIWPLSWIRAVSVRWTENISVTGWNLETPRKHT